MCMSFSSPLEQNTVNTQNDRNWSRNGDEGMLMLAIFIENIRLQYAFLNFEIYAKSSNILNFEYISLFILEIYSKSKFRLK